MAWRSRTADIARDMTPIHRKRGEVTDPLGSVTPVEGSRLLNGSGSRTHRLPWVRYVMLIARVAGGEPRRLALTLVNSAPSRKICAE